MFKLRCERCNKAIKKSKIAQVEYEKYKPYCSYHCQQWATLSKAKQHLNSLSESIESKSIYIAEIQFNALNKG